MISIIRRMVNSKIGLVLTFLVLGLAALAFAAGDISGGGGTFSLGGNNGTVAKVGSARLTANDLQSRTELVFDRQRQQSPDLDMSSFLAMGAVEDILGQLINSVALSEFATEQGMHNSKRLIEGEIGSIDAFKDASGKFSVQLYQDMLRRQSITDASLRQDISRDLYSRQLLAPVSMGSAMSRDMVLPYASLLLEGRKGHIAIVPSKLLMSSDQPNPTELAEFYKRNAERFTIPEQRQLRYVLIDRARFEKNAAPSDADIQLYYTENKANYTAREERTLEQVILPTQAAAQTIADKVKGGTSLAAAAKSAGLAVAGLSDLSQQQYAEKSSDAVAKAVFAAPRGGIAQIAKSPLGWHVVRVSNVTTTPAKTLAAAREEIVKILTDQKAAEAMSDFLANAEDQIAGGTTFEEFAKDASLPIKATPLIVSGGVSPQKPDYQPAPEISALLKPAFDMELDDDPQMVTVAPDQAYALLDVTDIKAAAPPPLEKVHDRIVQQFQLDRAAAKAKSVAEQIAAKVNKGTDLSKALNESGLKLPPTQAVSAKRTEIARGDQRVPPPLALLFSMAEGSVKTLDAGNDQGYFIVKLDSIQRGDAGKQPAIVDAVKQQMSRVVGNEYVEQFARAAQADVGVKRNAAAVAKVKQQLRGTASPQ